MSVHEISSPDKIEEYLELRDSENLVVVDISAVWCGPCKRIAPIFKQIAEETEDVVFVHIDYNGVGGEKSSLVEIQEVRGFPTFLFFKGGEKVDEFVGAKKELLLSTISKHR